jgi:PPOX class probable F420-dependent enzyme
VFPDPESDVGRRFRERLRTDLVAWLTLVADSGTPQPSPVGFLWVEETEDVVIYSQATARRLDWLDRRDRASLHLSDDGQGRDYLVMTGTLHRVANGVRGAVLRAADLHAAARPGNVKQAGTTIEPPSDLHGVVRLLAQRPD